MIIMLASQPQFNISLPWVLNVCFRAFNQKKLLVGAFSVIVKTSDRLQLYSPVLSYSAWSTQQ